MQIKVFRKVESNSRALRYLRLLTRHDDIFFVSTEIKKFLDKYSRKVLNREEFDFEREDILKVLEEYDCNLYNETPPTKEEEEDEELVMEYKMMLSVREYLEKKII